MNSKIWLWIGIGSIGFYVISRYKEGTPLSGESEKIIDSAMPWLGIRNPIVREVIKKAGNKFTQNMMGGHEEVIDVEFKKI